MANCGVLRDDYLECLHNRKEVSSRTMRTLVSFFNFFVHFLCQRDRKETIKKQELLNAQIAKDAAAGIKPAASGHH